MGNYLSKKCKFRVDRRQSTVSFSQYKIFPNYWISGFSFNPFSLLQDYECQSKLCSIAFESFDMPLYGFSSKCPPKWAILLTLNIPTAAIVTLSSFCQGEQVS